MKRKKSPERDWLLDFKKELSPRFVRLRRRLFVSYSTVGRKRLAAAYKNRNPTTSDELFMNTTEFRYDFDPKDRHDEWFIKNRALGEVALLAWKHALKQQHPRLRATMILLNEYQVAIDERGRRAWDLVVPTLKLWSFDPTTHADLAEAFRLDQLTPSKVLWRERYDEGLLDLDEIFRLSSLPDDSDEKRRMLGMGPYGEPNLFRL